MKSEQVNVTPKEVFLLASKRLSEDRAKIVRRACLKNEEARRRLYRYAQDAEQIYQLAFQEFVQEMSQLTFGLEECEFLGSIEDKEEHLENSAEAEIVEVSPEFVTALPRRN